MVNKALSSSPPSEIPELDESWWRSLLLEEEHWVHQNELAGGSHAPTEPAPKPKEIDWPAVAQCYEADDVIQATVYGYNQGGLLLENDQLQGFVPTSHLIASTAALAEGSLPPDWERASDSLALQSLLSTYVGRTLCLKIIECDPERGRIVLSERAAQSEPGMRTLLLENICPGQRLRGPVTNITHFGVFVELGGLEGLVHISELSWGRVQHPGEVVQVGDEIEVLVLRIEREQHRIALSVKRLHPNPWETVNQRYQVGQHVSVEITTLTHFGAFARLEPGLDGLIHVSQMPHNGKKASPHSVVQKGDIVTARIIHIDATRQRLGLSILTDD
ncbi:MAG: hypothetical protein Fur0018_18830 [Anaerolineales bacterium]